MQEHGLSLADISSKAPGRPSSATKGAKVAAKYRNKATGETWSGRGLQPKWLKAALSSGSQVGRVHRLGVAVGGAPWGGLRPAAAISSAASRTARR